MEPIASTATNTPPGLNMAVLAGIGIYLVITLVIGFLASRRVSDATDFIVAGRRLPLWLCTATLAATWFGGATVIGAAGAAYQKGLLGVIADPFGAALALFLAGLFYVRMMRRMRLATVSDFFDWRYSRGAGALASACLLLVYIGWAGSLFVAMGFVLHALTGIPAEWAIVIGTAIILLYTTAGGMWAVSVTDFFQILVVVLGLLVIFPIVVKDAGGISRLKTALPDDLFHIYPHRTSLTDWLWYIQAWFVIGLGNIPGQDLLQRSLSAKDERVAQNSAYLAGLLYITVGLIPVFIGIIGILLKPNIDNPEFLVPQLALEYLPTAAIALFVGALLAAIMSSADSAILAPSSIIGENILRYFKADASQQQVLRWTRMSVPILGCISLGVALYFKTVYHLFVNSYSILLVSLFVPLTAGIWWSKANTRGTLAAIFTGLAAWLLFKWITPEWPSDLIGLVASALVLFPVSLATQKGDPPKPLLDVDGQRLEYRHRLGLQ